jgi:ribosomal protein L36
MFLTGFLQMKYRSALKLMCIGCRFVKRGKFSYVKCLSHANHKQKQVATFKKKSGKYR